ncbi:HNH endonuclease signature motif containing protein [Mycolicibacterium sp. P9-64]|uniref:HNH endonuclease signature motif containing protein n=1 Tax=Mycolicibacterium sp. P9-64 TaxID=2024612 RepID=UPI0015652AF8|nr:HNH endonuclease signature motif containing protein [Mycolicibacterium sp. P9-64]
MVEELAQGDDLAHVDDAALVDAVAGWTRAAATVAHHRMAAIAELTHRRCTSEQAVQRELWACDGWDSAAAEIAAASGISPRTASTQMCQALALRHRLPQIAKLVADGTLAAPLAHTMSWRTRLIEDPDIMAAVDADLAAIAGSLGPLSVTKVENAIDAAILIHDPAAVLRFHTAAKSCDVKFGDADDTTGTTSMWARLSVADAELVARRLTQLTANPCPHDPRSIGERRSAALGVISAGGTHLPCTCGRPDCTASGPDARAEAIVIHILTDHHPHPGATTETTPDPGPPPPDPGPGPIPEPGLPPGPPPDPGPNTGPTPDGPPAGSEHGTGAEPAADFDPEPEPVSEPSDRKPHPEHRCPASGLAVIAGGGIVPTPLLAELIALGAPVRRIPTAAELCAEPHYRPSTRLQRFVRNRDQTCTFPGCDRAAERCDLDHSTPHGPGGLTHPGNLKSLCRKHHLLKTFWIGPTGWTDQQLGDGTIVWISPTGHRYTRPPGARLHFPHWDTTTPLPPGTVTPQAATGTPERGLIMPTRTTTRAQQTAQRRRAERQRNQHAIDEDPPPF